MAMLLPLTLGGCGDDHPAASGYSAKSTDQAAESACTIFSARYQRAGTKAKRLSLADEVGRYAGRSDNGAVAGRAVLVGRSASRGDDSWRAASKSFLQACHSAGWKSR
ncbi:hypothetical protein [Paractinoplanes durhamensis]|nr:hypothetical protein [Actinoplanes durhamensis]